MGDGVANGLQYVGDPKARVEVFEPEALCLVSARDHEASDVSVPDGQVDGGSGRPLVTMDAGVFGVGVVDA